MIKFNTLLDVGNCLSYMQANMVEKSGMPLEQQKEINYHICKLQYLLISDLIGTEMQLTSESYTRVYKTLSKRLSLVTTAITEILQFLYGYHNDNEKLNKIMLSLTSQLKTMNRQCKEQIDITYQMIQKEGLDANVWQMYVDALNGKNDYWSNRALIPERNILIYALENQLSYYHYSQLCYFKKIEQHAIHYKYKKSEFAKRRMYQEDADIILNTVMSPSILNNISERELLATFEEIRMGVNFFCR